MRWREHRRLAAAIWLAGTLAACAEFPQNPPLGDEPVGGGYRYARVAGAASGSEADPWSRETLVFVSISGGGTRAAAFGYGVLDQLRRTCIDVGGARRRLLDEVDVISSNSGGSYAAAYYGLFGEAMFAEEVDVCGVAAPAREAGIEDFEARFLRRPFQDELANELFNPATVVRILSPLYSRTDRAAELVDDMLYERTFADLEAAGRPFVVLNAHDTNLAGRFAFTQESFDLLCADLGAVPVGRAVMASSAVHGAFRSVRLVNYDGRACWPSATADPRQRPLIDLQIANGLASRESNFARYLEARRLQQYRYGACWYREGPDLDSCLAGQVDPLTVHLNDGGVVDNLGLDTLAEFLLGRIGEFNAFSLLQTGELRRLVVVIADARRGLDIAGIEDARDGSGVEDALQALDAGIDAKSNASVALVDGLLETWVSRNARFGLPSVEVLGPAVLRVDVLEDPAEEVTVASVRCWSEALGTTFQLDDEEVDAAIHAGRRAAYAAPSMRRVTDPLGGAVAPADEVAERDYCATLKP